MDEKTKRVLSEIGLGKVEIAVYIDLLVGRASTASDIAKRTRQHRSNVYDALKRLEQKGFIAEIIREGKKLFEAKDPEIILGYMQQKASEVKDILPSLENLAKDRQEHDVLTISSSVAKCRMVLFDLMKAKKFSAWGVHPEIIKNYLGEALLAEWEMERIRKKVSSRMIYTEKFKGMREIAQSPYQEVRYIGRRKSKELVILAKDAVFIIVFSKPITIIEARGELVDWFSGQFEITWGKARRPLFLREIAAKKAKAAKEAIIKGSAELKEAVVRKATTLRKKSRKIIKELKSNNVF
jgi:sugar-specific transcriptional regulator TrmB